MFHLDAMNLLFPFCDISLLLEYLKYATVKRKKKEKIFHRFSIFIFSAKTLRTKLFSSCDFN